MMAKPNKKIFLPPFIKSDNISRTKTKMIKDLIMLLIGIGLVDCDRHRFNFRNKISKFRRLNFDVAASELVQLKTELRFAIENNSDEQF